MFDFLGFCREDIKLQGYEGRRIPVFCQDHDHYHFQLNCLIKDFVMYSDFHSRPYTILHAGTHADIEERIASYR